MRLLLNETFHTFLNVSQKECRIIYIIFLLQLKKSCSVDSLKRSTAVLADRNCVQYYSPGHLAKENFSLMNFKLAVTYISFNAAGTEMLVNMGGEQIYLFDINSSKHINEILIPSDFTSKKVNLHRPCCDSAVSNMFFNSRL